MDAARAAVHKFTNKSGHSTDVEETVRPAVTSETVKPTRHEEFTEAVDREVHQHHYHTTVQPISHQEVLPEKHTQNIIPTAHKDIRHENEADTKQRVSAELGKFQNTSTTHETKHSQAQAPVVAGEHVHHHVHETVQPIIHKETIQPQVVHTIVPVHETHTVESSHHGMSALPMKTLDEFKTAGGLLDGNQRSSHEQYEGAPRPYNEKLRTTMEKLGLAGSGAAAGGAVAAGGVGHNKSHRTADSGVGMQRRDSASSLSSSDEEKRGGAKTHKQGGIKDKLNPRTDADRDGRVGVMD